MGGPMEVKTQRILRLAVWIASRILEVLLGGAILLELFGPGDFPPFPGLVGNLLYSAGVVFFFYISSGFIVSAIFFGLIKRKTHPLSDALIMGAAFLAHFAAVCVLTGLLPRALLLAALGFSTVVLVNFLGNIVQRRAGNSGSGAVWS